MKLFRLFILSIQEIFNDIYNYYVIKLDNYRVKQCIKRAIVESKTFGNRRLYIIRVHTGRPEALTMASIKELVAKKYFREHVSNVVWLFNNAIEIIDGNVRRFFREPGFQITVKTHNLFADNKMSLIKMTFEYQAYLLNKNEIVELWPDKYKVFLRPVVKWKNNVPKGGNVTNEYEVINNKQLESVLKEITRNPEFRTNSYEVQKEK